MPVKLSFIRAKSASSKVTGFTLIEIIIGIVVFAISLAVIIPYLAPAEENSADQIHQIKAAQLAQALMDDIMSRAFDENSDMAGGLLRCDEDQNDSGSVEADERCSTVMGPDSGETSRSLFDDVDDFNNYGQTITASTTTDGNLDSSYQNFTINVTVDYDGRIEVRLAKRLAKRITIVVTTPLGTEIAFSVYKTNF